MKVMVTGGAGYIGSVVTEELLKSGHEVVVLDNLSKGHRAAVPSDVPFVEVDLCDAEVVKQALHEYYVDAVIHMAAASLVGESVIEPRLYYRNNVFAGITLLNAMLDRGIKRIVFSSTAAVYGEPAKQPIEETDPLQPTNPYGATKLAFEEAMKWYHDAYALSFCSLRYFNAAGATEQFGEDHYPETHLIPILLQVAAGNRSYAEIYGNDYPTPDGTCIRDYIHVKDLARAHVLALENQTHSEGIFNLGCGGEGYSVLQVLEIARLVTQREIPTRFVARRPGDPSVLIASSTRIKKELGWNPQHQDLTNIIESAWNWLQEHPGGYKP